MVAGLTCSVNFIRLVYTDDAVGGSYPTGTVLHSNIEARIKEEPADVLLLQQGLETKKIFSAMFWGYNLQFQEQDEVVVISPPNHKYFGKRFRVVSTTEPNNHPEQKRNYYLAKLERHQTSHAEVFQ